MLNQSLMTTKQCLYNSHKRNVVVDLLGIMASDHRRAYNGK
jgi:hypothetical protein